VRESQSTALAPPTNHVLLEKPPLVKEPLFLPTGRDEVDMRLLWFYTTNTWASYSSGALKIRQVDKVLRETVVQHAFAHPFLMNCLLGLAAMHINHCKIRDLGVPASREYFYRAKAFETYRHALQVADPATYPALLACSLFLCGLSTDGFRGDDAKPLYILDWIMLWRGIGTIADIIKDPAPFKTDVAALLSRPEVDLAASARHLPNHLLFMVASIKQGDPEYPLIQPYYCSLQYLGSLYLELSNGFSLLLWLRIATFLTYLPSEFVDAARQRKPRALIILAHYLVFLKFTGDRVWWMQGISNNEIPNICNFLGPKWASMLRVPMSALLLTDHKEIAKLLLENPCWEPALENPEKPPLASVYEGIATRALTEVKQITEQARAYQERRLTP
jgi:hypothetical protein